MGCDIHTIWQARKVLPAISVGGVLLPAIDSDWQDVPHNHDEVRWYGLFTFLAGVRRYNASQPQICAPRGLPEDFEVDDMYYHSTEQQNIGKGDQDSSSPPTEPYEYDMGDHSFSWLLGSEIMAAKEKYNLIGFEDFFNEITRMLALHGEIRLVFGFDN